MSIKFDEVPLAIAITRPTQLRVGQILFGWAMKYAWVVHQITGDVVELVSVSPSPQPLCMPTDHVFEPGKICYPATRSNYEVCRQCQLRRQDVENFLPLRDERPRVWALDVNR